MTSSKISNEMIYERLDAQDRRMGDIYKLLKETREDLHDYKGDMREFKRDTQASFKSVRADIAALEKNHFTWNTGLVALIIAFSSFGSLLLLRLFSWLGVKVVWLASASLA